MPYVYPILTYKSVKRVNIYIYIYIYIERERERNGEGGRERKIERDLFLETLGEYIW